MGDGRRRCCCNDQAVGAPCTVVANAVCRRLNGTQCTPCQPELHFATPDALGRVDLTIGIGPFGGPFVFPCSLSLLEFWVTPAVITCGGTDFWFRDMTIQYGCATDPRLVVGHRGRAFAIPLSPAGACCSGGCVISISVTYEEKVPVSPTCECFELDSAHLVAVLAGSVGSAGRGLFYCDPPGVQGICDCFTPGAQFASATHTQPLWGFMAQRSPNIPGTWFCGGLGETLVDLGLCNPDLLGTTIFAGWNASVGFVYELVANVLTLLSVNVQAGKWGGGNGDSIDDLGCAGGANCGRSSVIGGSPVGAVNVNLGTVTTNLQLCKAILAYFSGRSYVISNICGTGPSCMCTLA